MEKECKKGEWYYYYSESIKDKFAVNEKTFEVYFETGKVRYSAWEIKCIIKAMNKGNGYVLPFPPEVHLIKKMFRGEIDYIGKKGEV